VVVELSYTHVHTFFNLLKGLIIYLFIINIIIIIIISVSGLWQKSSLGTVATDPK
jgi:hypothetical protein